MIITYTCKECENEITTDILPSNGICPECRNKEEKYPLDGIIGWKLTKIEYGKVFIEFILVKKGWYRKKIRVEAWNGEAGPEIGVLDTSFSGSPWVIMETGEKLHY